MINCTALDFPKCILITVLKVFKGFIIFCHFNVQWKSSPEIVACASVCFGSIGLRGRRPPSVKQSALLWRWNRLPAHWHWPSVVWPRHRRGGTLKIQICMSFTWACKEHTIYRASATGGLPPFAETSSPNEMCRGSYLL